MIGSDIAPRIASITEPRVGARAWQAWARCARVGAALLVACLCAAPVALRAQDYPARPIKVIVPFPAGGITDVLPRIMGEWLTGKWGQPVIIDNRPGAGGNIGAEAAFKSEPDGYTLMVTAPAPLTVNASLYQKLGFDPAAFVPVSILATIPTGLLVNPRLPIRTVAELIAFAKANPGGITAATQGKGTTSHLTSEWFQVAAGVKFVQVPYRGSAPALQGLVAGDVDVMFDNIGVSLALANSGQLRLIAVGTPARLPALPDLPAIAETLPAFVSTTWVGAFLPPNTARPIADRLSADFATALRQPDIMQRFRDHGCEPVGGTPAATAAFVRSEAALWKRVIAEAGITAD
jgi:tripartite-type tricarboxylate transporter receptor subunit TctC